MTQPRVSLDGNPVRELRFKLRKTTKQIAKEAGIHEQLWYLTECGCFDRISPRILRYFDLRGFEIDHAQYDKFRYKKQVDFGVVYFTPYEMPPVDIREVPLELFININRIDNRSFFAKELAIQPSLVYRVFQGNAKELPRQIVNALTNAGVAPTDIEELNERTIEYYEAHAD